MINYELDPSTLIITPSQPNDNEEIAAFSNAGTHSHLRLSLGDVLGIRRFSHMRRLRPISLFRLLGPISLLGPINLLRPIHTIPLRPTRRPVRPGLGRARGPAAHEARLGELLGGLERIDAFLGRFQAGGHKGLLEVVDDVFDVFQAETDADEIWGDAAFDLLFVGELLVRSDPRVNDEGLGVADVGEMAAEFEVVDDGADFVDVTSLAQGLEITWEKYNNTIQEEYGTEWEYIPRQR